MRNKAIRSLALVLALALPVGTVAPACATRLAAPAQLSPIGDVAFYADRALVAIDSLGEFAIKGEAAGAMSTDDARTIIEAVKTSSIAANELGKALKAGVSETTAKAKAIAIIREALKNVPQHLSPETQSQVAPYIQTVLTLLTVFDV